MSAISINNIKTAKTNKFKKNMEISVIRFVFSSGGIFGLLAIDGEFYCNTLEDSTCKFLTQEINYITEGTYPVDLSFSTHFKCITPKLHLVKGFRNIRISPYSKATMRAGAIQVGILDEDFNMTNSQAVFDGLVHAMLLVPDIITFNIY
jgi:hypothetical protein